MIRRGAFAIRAQAVGSGPGSSGELTNLQPGFRPGGEDNLFSATVDFVF
jgi:hypothetical protein